MKTFARVASLALGSFSLALPISAGGVVEPSPLKITVSAPRSTACVGDKALSIEITVVNQGQSKITFDSRHLAVHAGYAALFDTTSLKRRTDGMSVQQDRIPSASDHPTMIELQQNQAYVRQASLPLPSSFFREPGFYMLMPLVSIDAFTNQADPKAGIIFEVRDCD